ncbi:MAG: zinc ribbon domain-containing protein [Faecalibacterium sp.]
MNLNQLKDTSITYLQKGKDMAVDAAEKSRVEVLVLNNKARLYRAQRQLGALVYSLAKGHEENQPLVDKYVSVIASIEKEIETLKASLTPAQKAEVEAVQADVVATQVVEEPVVAAQTPAEYVVVETEIVE